jgi:hypothetical protein
MLGYKYMQLLYCLFVDNSSVVKIGSCVILLCQYFYLPNKYFKADIKKPLKHHKCSKDFLWIYFI